MIFAEVASRVGLLGKVNLPREPGERARGERRKREKGWVRGDSVELQRGKVLENYDAAFLHPPRPAIDRSALVSYNFSPELSPFPKIFLESAATVYAEGKPGSFSSPLWPTPAKWGTIYGQSFLSELVLYLTTHQRRANAHLPAGESCVGNLNSRGGKSG